MNIMSKTLRSLKIQIRMTKDEVLQCTVHIPSNAYLNATIYIEGLLRMSSHLFFVKLETKNNCSL
jgi:hypothetical protein